LFCFARDTGEFKWKKNTKTKERGKKKLKKLQFFLIKKKPKQKKKKNLLLLISSPALHRRKYKNGNSPSPEGGRHASLTHLALSPEGDSPFHSTIQSKLPSIVQSSKKKIVLLLYCQ
jgi:hypothetical protein